MISISVVLKNIRNNLPYFLLIAIYFFFVNIEAGKEKDNDRNAQKEKVSSNDKSRINQKRIRINIPVIPYKQ